MESGLAYVSLKDEEIRRVFYCSFTWSAGASYGACASGGGCASSSTWHASRGASQSEGRFLPLASLQEVHQEVELNLALAAQSGFSKFIDFLAVSIQSPL